MTGGDLNGRTAIIHRCLARNRAFSAISQQLAAAGPMVVLTGPGCWWRSAEAARRGPGKRPSVSALTRSTRTRPGAARSSRWSASAASTSWSTTREQTPAYGPLADQDHARFNQDLRRQPMGAAAVGSSLAVKSWMGEHGVAVVNTDSTGGMHQSLAMGMYNATKACADPRHSRSWRGSFHRVSGSTQSAPERFAPCWLEALWKDHYRGSAGLVDRALTHR